MMTKEYIAKDVFYTYVTAISMGHITDRILPTHRNFFTCVDDINRVVANRKRGK